MLKYRLISGSLLVAILFVVTLWKSPFGAMLFAVFGFAVLILGLREFFAITARIGAPGFPRLTIVASFVYAAGPVLQAHLPDRLIALAIYEQITIAFFIIGCFVQVFRAADLVQGLRNFLASAGGFLYLGWSLSFLCRIFWWGGDPVGNGSYLFFYLVLVTKFGDIGGYTFGKLTSKFMGGNHKMIPRLSPGKSWEGLVGSIVFSIGIALYISWWLGPHLEVNQQMALTPMRSVFVAFFLACLGLTSDLTESVLKRAGDVKDSGHTLPGLGGVLDTIDSLLLVSPLYYCYLCFVASGA